MALQRSLYHFEPRTGWINDPNGLVWYRGQYHAFFQHNPYSDRWGRMHWGHAVSRDLIHWEQLPIALWPDEPYERCREDEGGCFSGSAVVIDGRLWLIYTTVSDEFGQTQSLAYSDDGRYFEKFSGNPVIGHFPADGCPDFRDPKVEHRGGRWQMVLGSGKDGVGRVLRYTSEDLQRWEYAGVFAEDPAFGAVVECPDFFALEEKYILKISRMNPPLGDNEQFVVGHMEGEHFCPEQTCLPEAGPNFYASQSFLDPQGRRILIGWVTPHGKPRKDGAREGAFSLPRELTLRDGRLCSYPIAEARHLLTDHDPAVSVEGNTVCIRRGGETVRLECGAIERVDILHDGHILEVFVNFGERNATLWVE